MAVSWVWAQAAPATTRDRVKNNHRPVTVMREVESARRKRVKLSGCGWRKVLVMGLMLVCCIWPGISLEGVATAASVTHLSLSASPCDTLQEVRHKKQDLRTYLTLSAHPGDTLPEIERKNKDIRKLLRKTPWPKLEFFSADGRTYSLPLRAESREPSNRPAKARLEYLAGFFDGDGCIACVSAMCRPSLHVVRSFDQAEVLMLFRETFGGSITRHEGGKGLRKPKLQWRAFGDSARRAALLLAAQSITKQRQLLLADQWPDEESRRADCKAELHKLKEYDSAVAGPCSWAYFAGFFDAEGYIHQPMGGASLRLEITHKYPQVLGCLRDFLSRRLGLDASPRKEKGSVYVLRISGLSDCKRILQHMLGAGMVSKTTQAEIARGLTKQSAAQVSTRLACLTGNQMFGKKLDRAGRERARKIRNVKTQATLRKRQGRLTEAADKQCEVALLKHEHELLNARYENQELIEYFRKLQRLHENSWEGPLAQGM